MPWLRLKLLVDDARAQLLADALEEWGAIAVTLEDAADQPLYETHWNKNPLWSQVSVTGLFPEHADTDAILAQVRDMLNLTNPPAHDIDLLGDEDWAHSWKAHYHPLNVGHHLWVVPSWCTPPEPTAINIILDPGLAFGTGDHPTTALCLAWLSEQVLAGKTVLDYGCGSGILAIAALKLGAASVCAVDMDAMALAVTRDNAARNGIQRGMDVMHADQLPAGFQADIVLANILSGTLMELAAEITSRVRPGGMLALSGLLAGQVGEVRTRYEPSFTLTVHERSQWALLTGRKPADLG
jgi:ribosomal protein L11 methyltransferase